MAAQAPEGNGAQRSSNDTQFGHRTFQRVCLSPVSIVLGWGRRRCLREALTVLSLFLPAVWFGVWGRRHLHSLRGSRAMPPEGRGRHFVFVLVASAFWREKVFLNTSKINIAVAAVRSLLHCCVLSVNYYLNP